MTAHGTFFAFAALSTLAAAAAPPPVLASDGQDLAKTSQNPVGGTKQGGTWRVEGIRRSIEVPLGKCWRPC